MPLNTALEELLDLSPEISPPLIFTGCWIAAADGSAAKATARKTWESRRFMVSYLSDFISPRPSL
jgi:hypothetical protein